MVVEILLAIIGVFVIFLTFYTIKYTRKTEKALIERQNSPTYIGYSYIREQMEKESYNQNHDYYNLPATFGAFFTLFSENPMNSPVIVDSASSKSFFENLNINIDTEMVVNNQIMCVMPFLNDYDGVFKTITESCKKQNFNCIRTDQENKPGNLLQYIVKTIVESQLLIAVIDNRNPNVFYEMGIAHSLGKSVILVCQQKDASKVPFDIQSNRVLFYEDLNDLSDKLDKALIAVKANYNVERKTN